jgi:hypothetical protein
MSYHNSQLKNRDSNEFSRAKWELRRLT